VTGSGSHVTPLVDTERMRGCRGLAIDGAHLLEIVADALSTRAADYLESRAGCSKPSIGS
jgi:hypothetical protein